MYHGRSNTYLIRMITMIVVFTACNAFAVWGLGITPPLAELDNMVEWDGESLDMGFAEGGTYSDSFQVLGAVSGTLLEVSARDNVYLPPDSVHIDMDAIDPYGGSQTISYSIGIPADVHSWPAGTYVIGRIQVKQMVSEGGTFGIAVAVNYDIRYTKYDHPYCYIAESGSDITGDGSKAKPFATFNKGIGEIADGGVLFVENGSYLPPDAVVKSINIISVSGNPELCIVNANNYEYGFNFLAGESKLQGLSIVNAINANIYGGIVSISNCKIENSSYGVQISYGNVIVEHSLIQNNSNIGIYAIGGTIQKNSIIGNGRGIVVSGNERVIINANEVINNNGDGIFIQSNTTGFSYNLIANNDGWGVITRGTSFSCNKNTIVNNSNGIRIEAYTHSNIWANIKNSIIWNNGDNLYLVSTRMMSFVTISSTDIKGGREAIYNKDASPWLAPPNEITWDNTNIDTDPLLATDYHLTDFSPCIGAGSDGTDMGAFEHPLDAPLSSTPPVSEASDYIHQYAYTFDGYEYVPVHPLDNTLIQPWEGFWVAVPNQSEQAGEAGLLIPKSDTPPEEVPQLVVQPNRHYMFSVPLQTLETDLNASSLGQQLGDGQSEQSWRVGKWMWDTEGYHNYNGPDPQYDELMSVQPGKGFWLQQITDGPIAVDLEGTKVDPESGYYEIKLPKNDLDVPYTFHMVGNPYWYPVRWGDFKVRIPMTDTLPTAKPSVAEEDIQSWYVGLKLQSSDGTARDTYNRAGVVTQGDDTYFDALDMTPMGEYVRMMFVDGDQQLAYDYRPDGLSEYTWDIELTTSYPEISTSLTIDNLDVVPDGFSLTLIDKDTGDEYAIADDMTVPIDLSSGSSKNFQLIAMNSNPITVEEQKPVAFGIQGVMPNPFNPVTTVQYTLALDSDVSIQVYNVNGQRIETLVDNPMNAGTHSVVWNAQGQSSGLYFIALEANAQRDVKKVMLMK